MKRVVIPAVISLTFFKDKSEAYGRAFTCVFVHGEKLLGLIAPTEAWIQETACAYLGLRPVIRTVLKSHRCSCTSPSNFLAWYDWKTHRDRSCEAPQAHQRSQGSAHTSSSHTAAPPWPCNSVSKMPQAQLYNLHIPPKDSRKTKQKALDEITDAYQVIRAIWWGNCDPHLAGFSKEMSVIGSFPN